MVFLSLVSVIGFLCATLCATQKVHYCDELLFLHTSSVSLSLVAFAPSDFSRSFCSRFIFTPTTIWEKRFEFKIQVYPWNWLKRRKSFSRYVRVVSVPGLHNRASCVLPLQLAHDLPPLCTLFIWRLLLAHPRWWCYCSSAFSWPLLFHLQLLFASKRFHAGPIFPLISSRSCEKHPALQLLNAQLPLPTGY